ncbi:MAG: hypothetical protein KDD25_01330 [Bdellovibrionales bacterium]|nr:hypothetical protein [Bdellovibrionales bacterium]
MGDVLSGDSSIAFLIKSFPEFDHSAPLIVELSSSKKVYVVPLYPFDLVRQNPFYKKIKSISKFEEIEISNHFPIVYRLVSWIYTIAMSRRWKGAYRLESLLHRWTKKFLNKSNCFKFFEKMKTEQRVQTCVFHTGNEVLGDFAKSCRKLDIKTALMAHAVHMFKNRLLWNYQLKVGKTQKVSDQSFYNEMDMILMPDALSAQNLIESGVRGEKVKICGSPRFSHEWIARFDEIFPMASKTRIRKRILFFLTKEDSGVFVEEVDRTIQYLSDLGSVDLVLKVHPRMDTRKYGNLKNVKMATHFEHSSSLIREADLVLFLDSSIVFDSFLRKVPSAWLSYSVVNDLVFDEGEGPVKLKTRDDFVHLIDSLVGDQLPIGTIVESGEKAVRKFTTVNGKSPIRQFIGHLFGEVELAENQRGREL